MEHRTTVVTSAFLSGVIAVLALLSVLTGPAVPVQADPPAHPCPASLFQADTSITRYVTITGTDAHTCANPISPCRTVQYAVDVADEGDVIKVTSGVYTGVNTYGGLAQVVYVSKTVTIRGGYTTTNWTTPDPDINPTTLDAQGQGRVLYITGDISPTVEGLYITGGDAAGLGGGGMYIITATATISNNRVLSNTACWGGGLCLYHSDATLSRNTISSNTAEGAHLSWGGGGLYLYYSNATLNGNTVTSNTAHYGGGLYLWSSAPTLNENVVTANTVHEDGGGLFLWFSPATLNGNTILTNVAYSAGGGLFADSSAITLSRNIVTANIAGLGGGLLLLWPSETTLNENIIAANIADLGGGLCLFSCDVSLNGNTIISNTADLQGGGLYLADSNATLVNNLVADNETGKVGSGLYIEFSFLRMLHTTIARNSGGDGSGIYVTNYEDGYSTVALTNTILVSHTVGITVTAGNTVTLEATLWGTGTWANGSDWCGDGTITTGTVNIWGDPAFVNPDIGNYHIGAGSAAIDRGVNAGVTDDMDGDPRPIGAAPDIGADELWQVYLPSVLRQCP